MIKKLFNFLKKEKSLDRFNMDMLELNRRLIEEEKRNEKIR